VCVGLSVLELRPMYAIDRQTDVRRTSYVGQKYRLMPHVLGAGTQQIQQQVASRITGIVRLCSVACQPFGRLLIVIHDAFVKRKLLLRLRNAFDATRKAVSEYFNFLSDPLIGQVNERG